MLIPSLFDPFAIHDNVASEIDAITAKTAPVAGDIVLIEDSEASFVKKELSLSNLSKAVDHGLLAGLADDDHVQYLLLLGRSSGQIAIGGTDSGDDLTLKSTSNATKGVIIADGETVRMKRLLAGGVT